VLLKAIFPLAIRSDQATFETMYGAISRSVYRNTSWDAARFEVAAHRWADLSEPGYGIAILNDAKYGYGVQDNVLNLSLLRSPMYPDALADEGRHHFTYSIYPHPGDWTESDVVAEAFALNSPLIVAPGGGNTAKASFVTAEGLPLALGSLKPAEDGTGVILRVYEPRGARGNATLRFDRAVASAARVTLLEDPDTDAAAPSVAGDTVTLTLRPFEVVSLKLAFA
jgi:alpha-mannosidase